MPEQDQTGPASDRSGAPPPPRSGDPWRTAPGAPPPPPPDKEEPKEPRHHRPLWRELPVLVVVAFAIALLLKSFVIQAFYIPSASMEPTLLVGDRVLVEKVSTRFGEPARGDIVVFEKDFGLQQPDENRGVLERIGDGFRELFGFPVGGKQDFIKRVVAVEGDTVEGRDGRVIVNGEVVEEPYLPEGVETSEFGPVDIPDDMIFVMGDNRNNSDDSRNFGPVPVETVVGEAFILIWPPADFATL